MSRPFTFIPSRIKLSFVNSFLEESMAKYKMDHDDILFTLNDVLNVSRHEKYGFDANSVKEILIEQDKFVENEIFPSRQKADEEGVRMTDEGVKVPECIKSVNKSYYDMGWFALGMPEEVGGSPVPEALAAACRSLGQGANTAWSMYPGLSKGCFNVLRLVGDDYVKSTYLEKMITGVWGGTMCLTESGAGSDVGNLKSTAKPIEGKDNWYHVKGTKIFISSGESDLYENNIHLVLARTPGSPEGTKGISLFLVPRYRVNDDGSLGPGNDVKCTSFEHKMGIHASATCVMNFGDHDDCEGYMIGNECEGMQNMFIMMNEARLDVGMQGESQANLAFELTKQYVNERVQFKQEIVKHPDVAKALLKMRAMARGLRAITLYATDLIDCAHDDKQAHDLLGFMTPICKSFCSDQGYLVATEAVQAHGGYGYCSEYGVEQFVRDTKIAKIYEGTNGIQAIDFVMRKILKDGGKTYGHVFGMIKADVEKLSDDFSTQKAQFAEAMQLAEKAMGYLAGLAGEKKMNRVLQSAKDFLDLSSHLIVAWRLLVAGHVAADQLAAGTGNKEFLETKIVDFKIYCSQYLPQVLALSTSILNMDEDILEYSI